MGVTVRARRRVEFVVSCLAALAAVVFVVIALVIAVPPSLANLTSTVSDGVKPQTLEVEGREASIVVPDGWVVRRQSDDALLVVTPDGALTVQLTLTDEDAARAVAASSDGAERTERLASGLRVFHIDTDDGVDAAIALGGAGTIVAIAEFDEAVSPAAYRPALAQLLEGVVP